MQYDNVDNTVCLFHWISYSVIDRNYVLKAGSGRECSPESETWFQYLLNLNLNINKLIFFQPHHLHFSFIFYDIRI